MKCDKCGEKLDISPGKSVKFLQLFTVLNNDMLSVLLNHSRLKRYDFKRIAKRV